MLFHPKSLFNFRILVFCAVACVGGSLTADADELVCKGGLSSYERKAVKNLSNLEFASRTADFALRASAEGGGAGAREPAADSDSARSLPTGIPCAKAEVEAIFLPLFGKDLIAKHSKFSEERLQVLCRQRAEYLGRPTKQNFAAFRTTLGITFDEIESSVTHWVRSAHGRSIAVQIEESAQPKLDQAWQLFHRLRYEAYREGLVTLRKGCVSQR